MENCKSVHHVMVGEKSMQHVQNVMDLAKKIGYVQYAMVTDKFS